jgi:hypothetical protein
MNKNTSRLQCDEKKFLSLVDSAEMCFCFPSLKSDVESKVCFSVCFGHVRDETEDDYRAVLNNPSFLHILSFW